MKAAGFRQRVCRWACRVHLVDLLQATLANNTQARDDALACLSRSWVAECEFGDLKDLEQLTFSELFELCHSKVGTLAAARCHCNGAAIAFMDSRFSWIGTSKFHSNVGPHSKTLSRYAKLLSEGSRPEEAKLAELVLKGSLRTDAVLKTIVTSCIMKCSRAGMKRRNRSSFSGLDESDIAEAGFALATCSLNCLSFGVCVCVSFGLARDPDNVL